MNEQLAEKGYRCPWLFQTNRAIPHLMITFRWLFWNFLFGLASMAWNGMKPQKTETALITNIYKMDTYAYKKGLYAAGALLYNIECKLKLNSNTR